MSSLRPAAPPVRRPATPLSGPAGRPHGVPERLRLLVIDPGPADGDGLDGLDDGWEVQTCPSAAEGLLTAGSVRPDVVLLASDVADLAIATVVELLDRRCGVPVVVATDGGHAEQAAAALEAGAVACVARPYRSAQLAAVISAVRRPGGAAAPDPVLRCGVLALDPSAGTVHLRGSLVLLPPREFRVLEHLMRHEGRVVSQSQLWTAVWGRSTPSTSNTVSVHVRRLRHRLGDDPREPRIIRTVGRSGYLLQAAAD